MLSALVTGDDFDNPSQGKRDAKSRFDTFFKQFALKRLVFVTGRPIELDAKMQHRFTG